MKKRSILIVDDEVDFPRLARMVLTEKGGFEVVVCHRGEQAIDMIREWKPDLLLLDIVMPNVDGTDIAAALRNDPELCSVPIIFFTSLMTPQEAAAHPVVGKHDFIPKPISVDALLKRVQEFFKRET